MNIPHIDPHLQKELSESDVDFFKNYGFLVIRNALCKEVRRNLTTWPNIALYALIF